MQGIEQDTEEARPPFCGLEKKLEDRLTVYCDAEGRVISVCQGRSGNLVGAEGAQQVGRAPQFNGPDRWRNLIGAAIEQDVTKYVAGTSGCVPSGHDAVPVCGWTPAIRDVGQPPGNGSQLGSAWKRTQRTFGIELGYDSGSEDLDLLVVKLARGLLDLPPAAGSVATVEGSICQLAPSRTRFRQSD
jgi:hypothetical protein